MVEKTVQDQNKKNISKVLIIGFSTFLMIFSVSILHANEYEFIILRFPGLTLFEVSLFDSVLYISYLIIGIIIGILADHLGKRKIFIIAGSAGSIIFFSLMITATNYGILLIFRFLQGSFTVMGWQMLMTLVLDIASPENRGKFLGIFGFFLALAMGFGPMFGGIIASYGVFIPYYVAIVVNVIVLIIVLLLLKDPSYLKKRPSFKENLTIIQRRPELIVPGIFNFVDRLHMGFIIFILPLFVQIVLGLGPEIRGMIMGIFALPFIILQYPMGKLSDKYGRYKLLIPGSLGYGIILTLTGYFGLFGLGLLIGAFLILGVFSGITGPPSMALVGDIAEGKDNAMAMGFFTFVGNLGMVIGPLIGGLVVDYGNFVFAFIIAGLIELISLGICLLFARKYRSKF
ncbi:MAG: MFS transporter [Candidatus Lokiarchaeota archaeon]|nr:MFS transporter [Candidatus Lokiarchaeota archaeon]